VGLDAAVYKNRRHLKLGPDENALQVVPETGQVYFENDELSRKYRDQLRAVKHRLGNIAEIGALRDEVTRLIGADSLIIQKILYSGTHVGDAIPREFVSALSAELDSIGDESQRSPELQRFIGHLKELVQAAKREGNPIVFV
jgi:hypothetical protein